MMDINFYPQLTSIRYSSRTRFMIETLANLKNNKLKRNATQNQGGEAVERMKKFLSGLTKKKHGVSGQYFAMPNLIMCCSVGT